MVADTGGAGFSLLRVDGGASQNGLLMQLQADAIQVVALSLLSSAAGTGHAHPSFQTEVGLFWALVVTFAGDLCW